MPQSLLLRALRAAEGVYGVRLVVGVVAGVIPKNPQRGVASGVVAGGSLMGVVLVFWANGGSIADHMLIGERRFRSEADKQRRVPSTAWVEDGPFPTSLGWNFCSANLPHCHPVFLDGLFLL